MKPITIGKMKRNEAIATYYVEKCKEMKSRQAIELTAQTYDLSVPQIYNILRRTEL